MIDFGMGFVLGAVIYHVVVRRVAGKGVFGFDWK